MNSFDYFFEYSKFLDKPFIAGNESINFQDIHDKSLELAISIYQWIGNGNNIFLLSPNNMFFIIVYLAALKSGNTIIPLDPRVEDDNYRYIYQQANPKLIFLSKDVKKRLKLEGKQYIEEIKDFVGSKKNDGDGLPFLAGNDFPAEIIFTSGSTGKPKGVVLTHQNLIANTSSIIQYLEINQNDRMLVVLPFYYCYGLSLLHTHLRVGGSLVLNNSFIFLGKVIQDLQKFNCTGFAGVPSHFQVLLRKSESFKSTKFPSLRYVTQAGGKLANPFIKEFTEYFPKVLFYVMYGQTEATARLSYLPPEKLITKLGSIGKGIPGVSLKVINKNNEVSPGETGEVIAKGDNIMQGYYKDDKDTEVTIRKGWLHTGDLATIDEEGYIYLTARKKEMIKTGGKRISPKEIEEVIAGINGVVDCYIEGITDEILGEAIKATVVVDNLEKSGLDSGKLKNYCGKYLALHKIPHVVEFSESLQVNTSGKRTRNKL